jgi:hypothetical protein
MFSELLDKKIKIFSENISRNVFLDCLVIEGETLHSHLSDFGRG